MLKLKLTKAEFDALPDVIKAEYQATTEGGYLLHTDTPFEDVTALKGALTNERAAHKTTKEQKAILDTQVTGLNEEVATLKARDLKPTDLQKSYEDKLTAQKATAAKREADLVAHIKTQLVDNVALTMANEISTSPALLVPHIKARLAAHEEDGQWSTRVVGADGKVSADSVKELQQQFVTNADFAPIIKGSSATGGGATGGKRPVGGKTFDKMTVEEKTTLYRHSPDEYRRLKAASTQPGASGQ